MAKRDRIPDKDNEEEEKEVDGDDDDNMPPKQRARADEEEEEEEEDEEDDDDDDDYFGSQSSPPLVCWLEEGATRLSVGELHFSNVDHTGSPDDPSGYCVVLQLKALPPTETALDYAFEGGFPFKVLPASVCVGIPPEDEEEKEEEPSSVFRLNPQLHQGMMEDLLPKKDDEDPECAYTPLPSNWRVPLPESETTVINGLEAWWKAGEAKAGWDLFKIPKDDSATPESLEGCANEKNVLLRLYKNLCAFRPLTPEDDRDTIEERFEWRTCLCTYFAWAVPNQAALDVLAALDRPVLEIGAGTGYWAWLLKDMGVDIQAYDLEDSQRGQKTRFRHSLVQDGGVEQVSKHLDRTLLLCWPDIVGDSAHDDADRGSFGLDTLQAYKGDTFVYVGELGPGVVRAAKGWGDPFPPGGSSASVAFQEELKTNFQLTQKVNLPNWPPYNSHLTVWKRKEVPKRHEST